MSDKKESKASSRPKEKNKTRSRPRNSARKQKGRGGGSRAFQQPNPTRSSQPRMTTNRKGDVAVIPGNDLLATINADTKFVAGDLLANFPINPVELTCPRLVAMSKLYKKFRITEMHFTYEPTATIAPGSLLGYVDYEPYDDPSSGSAIQRLQRARANFGERGVNITNHGRWDVVPMKEPLFIAGDSATAASHWYRYGRFVLYANSDIAAATACGSIIVHYNVEFSHPSYETPVTNVSGEPEGFGAWYHWNTSLLSYDDQKVFEPSDLKVTVTPQPPLTAYNLGITLPYDAEHPLQNDFMIYASWDSYLEDAQVVFVADYGVTQRWMQAGYFDGTYHRYNCAVGQYTVGLASNRVTMACSKSPLTNSKLWLFIARIPAWDLTTNRRSLSSQGESKESKEALRPVSLDRRSGLIAPPSTPTNATSSSSSALSQGVTSSSQSSSSISALSQGVTSSSQSKGWF